LNLNKYIYAIRHPIRSLYSDAFIYRLISKTRKHVFIIAAPKSGSSWASCIFSNLLKWKEAMLTHNGGRREQEIDIRKLVTVTSRENLFSKHQHCRRSKGTLENIRRARIKPIIQVRDIYDTVISLRDHMTKEDVVMPMAYMDKGWHNMSLVMQTEFIIDMIIPWYFNFYAGWVTSDLVQNNRAYILTYEKLESDPVKAVYDCCEWIGESVTSLDIVKAVEMAKTKKNRKNVGVVGRGHRLLTPKQREKILKMSLYYPDIDFSLIGINKNISS
jgi:hypothetical protein